MTVRRTAAIATAIATVAGVAVSAGLVWHASYSAFSARTTSPQNNWSAGTVSIVNNHGAVMFTFAKLRPGLGSDRCVTVTSSGSLPSMVKLYSTAGTYGVTKNLGSTIALTIQVGSTPSAQGCDTFAADSTLYSGPVATANLDDFGTTRTNFGSGVGAWSTTGTGSESLVYRFAWSFQPSGTQAQMDALQGGTAQIGFTWEAQNV